MWSLQRKLRFLAVSTSGLSLCLPCCHFCQIFLCSFGSQKSPPSGIPQRGERAQHTRISAAFRVLQQEKALLRPVMEATLAMLRWISVSLGKPWLQEPPGSQQHPRHRSSRLRTLPGRLQLTGAADPAAQQPLKQLCHDDQELPGPWPWGQPGSKESSAWASALSSPLRTQPKRKHAFLLLF